MQESVVQNAGALLTRASDDIDLHFIQKPASFDNFKQSFRCELCICECCCLDDIFVLNATFSVTATWVLRGRQVFNMSNQTAKTMYQLVLIPP